MNIPKKREEDTRQTCTERSKIEGVLSQRGSLTIRWKFRY